jgi:hypothetical protein
MTLFPAIRPRIIHARLATLSASQVDQATLLHTYGRRQAEADNWFSKERFGLADDRVQSVEAILRWHTVVLAVYASIQYRRVMLLLKNPRA